MALSKGGILCDADTEQPASRSRTLDSGQTVQFEFHAQIKVKGKSHEVFIHLLITQLLLCVGLLTGHFGIDPLCCS
jgi:hypothetical protein